VYSDSESSSKTQLLKSIAQQILECQTHLFHLEYSFVANESYANTHLEASLYSMCKIVAVQGKLACVIFNHLNALYPAGMSGRKRYSKDANGIALYGMDVRAVPEPWRGWKKVPTILLPHAERPFWFLLVLLG